MDEQNLRGAFGSQPLIHLTKYLRSRCSGGGGRFEFRQASIKLLPTELDAIPEGLFADMDIHRDDRDMVFFDQLAWKITGTVGDNADGLVSP
jgi:hypothetical protein